MLMPGGQGRSWCAGSKEQYSSKTKIEILVLRDGLLPRVAQREEKLEQTHLQRGVVCLPACAMSPRPAGPTHKGTWQPGPCSSGLLLAARQPLSPTRTRQGNSPSSRSGCWDSAASTCGAAGHSSARPSASRGCRQQSCSPEVRELSLGALLMRQQLWTLSARHRHNGKYRGIRSILGNSFRGAFIPNQCTGSEVPQGSPQT